MVCLENSKPLLFILFTNCLREACDTLGSDRKKADGSQASPGHGCYGDCHALSFISYSDDPPSFFD